MSKPVSRTSLGGGTAMPMMPALSGATGGGCATPEMPDTLKPFTVGSANDPATPTYQPEPGTQKPVGA
jgi:hypothetical protein